MTTHISITCLPCQNEAKYNSVIYEQSPLNVAFKDTFEDFFNKSKIHTCPFCEVTIEKSNIMEAFVNYLFKNELSFKLSGEILDISKEDSSLILRRQDFINNSAFSKLTDIPFSITKNEYELIRLMVLEIDPEQWIIKIENEKVYI